jgi:hypothetical protein
MTFGCCEISTQPCAIVSILKITLGVFECDKVIGGFLQLLVKIRSGECYGCTGGAFFSEIRYG